MLPVSRIVVLGSLCLAGCGSRDGTLPPAKANLQQVAILLGKYQGANKGKMPAHVDELKKFVKANPNVAAAPIDVETVFVSPRDQEPFVLVQAQSKGGIPPPHIKTMIAHEKTGQSGRRYVAYATAEVEEVDEARFNELLAGK